MSAALTPADFSTITIPRIGAELGGGIFAGIAAGVDGAPDYLLILGPEAKKAAGWDAQMKWAAGLDVAGNTDFSLPTRKEQALLFANVSKHFKNTWYWSSEQPESDPGYAWRQPFDSGTQGTWAKGTSFRARAVRRVPIR